MYRFDNVVVEAFTHPDKKRELWKLRKELNLLEVNNKNISTKDLRWQLPSTDLLFSKASKKDRGSLCDNNKSYLYLKDIVDTDAFKLSESKVTVAVGKNDQDDIVTADLAQLQHLLVGGRCSEEVLGFINSTIISLLFKSTPDDVRIVLIDTNGAGLSIYNELPHLIARVETDPDKAFTLLEFLSIIGSERCRLFGVELEGITVYNEKMDLNKKRETAKCDSSQDTLPKIVVIVTELADLMCKDADRTQFIIPYLAWFNKRTGMHMILGTQKPEIEVVGLIRYSMPSTIAFKTDNNIGSRMLVEKRGAEELKGEGDMLYRPNGQEDVTRIQAARISQKEIDNVVGFWKNISLHSDQIINIEK